MMDNERINRYTAQAIAAWEAANGNMADRRQAQEVAAIAVMLALRDTGTAAPDQAVAGQATEAPPPPSGFADLGASLLDMAFKSKFGTQTSGSSRQGVGLGQTPLGAEIMQVIEGVFGNRGSAGPAQQATGGQQQKADAAKEKMDEMRDTISRTVQDFLHQMEHGGPLHDRIGDVMEQASARVGEMADLVAKADQWIKRQGQAGTGTP